MINRQQPTLPQITGHTLRTSSPEISLDFYVNKIGMSLINTIVTTSPSNDKQHWYFLSFKKASKQHQKQEKKSIHDVLNHLENHRTTFLILLHQPSIPARMKAPSSANTDGYWKIGITLPDVLLAKRALEEKGEQVTEASQFLNVGFLCHLKDPDGYSIELLQHHFADHHQSYRSDPNLPLRTPPTLGQITLRIRDPEPSLKFYTHFLGMRLLSRQVIAPFRFTLYFLAFTSEAPPEMDVDAIANREWLWQRPYTVLELQHIWGTEQADFAYRTNGGTGFTELTLMLSEYPVLPDEYIVSSEVSHVLWQTPSLTIKDPDGYKINLVQL